MDVQAASTFDAAHIYLTHAKAQPGAGIPPLTLATVFEVVIGGKVQTVAGAALQRWIIKERSERKARAGCFSRGEPRWIRCGNPTEEREVFTGFLTASPMFAGAAVTDWRQPAQDPPDVEADLADGRKVGVELTSWLDESQIGREKKVEFIEFSFRDAIKPEPPNETDHICLVWLSPKRRMVATDRAAFRSELLALMDAIDKRWESQPDWTSPQGFAYTDFTKHPTLAKYLQSLDVHPRRPSVGSSMRKGSVHWLTFPARGGAYSPDWMVDALCQCIEAKTTKYGQNQRAWASSTCWCITTRRSSTTRLFWESILLCGSREIRFSADWQGRRRIRQDFSSSCR